MEKTIVKGTDTFQFIGLRQKDAIISDAFKEYVAALRRVQLGATEDTPFNRGLKGFAWIAIDMAKERIK